MSSTTQQQKAYDAGVQDGVLTGVQPTDLKFIQDFNEYDGEALVCYLNGVGDGVSGISQRGDLLKVPYTIIGVDWANGPDWSSSELPAAA